MQAATNEFKDNIKNGYPLYGSCKITLNDGTILTPEKSDFLMDKQGFRVIRSCSSASSFDIGTVSAAEFDLKLINYDGHLDNYDFEGAKIEKVNVNMIKPDGTIESIPKGIFYVETQDFNGGIVTLTAYDRLADMDKPYTGDKSGTAQALVTALATKYSLVLKNNFNNYDLEVSLPSNNTMEYTDREILGYLAQITCNYAYIDVNGYLVLAWYGDTEQYAFVDAGKFKSPSKDIISAGDVKDMATRDIISAGLFNEINNLHLIDTVFSTSSVGISDVLITGITVTDNENNEYNAGSKGYVLKIENNPFVNTNNGQNIADRIWNVAQLTRFRPMRVSILPNPLLDIGDCIYVKIKDNYYETVVTNIDFAIGSYTELNIDAESPSKNASYTSQISAAVKKAINQSANQTSALSSQFANLITQSLGMYEIHDTQADGSVITYLTSKPTLAESIGGTVWRMALNIFTVTNNYQGEATVWESGFDSQGNLKANVLEVIGISFDWAKGGKLQLGNKNNADGEMKVYDANGKLIGSWNNNGVYLYGNLMTTKLADGEIAVKGTDDAKKLSRSVIQGHIILVETFDSNQRTQIGTDGLYTTGFVSAGNSKNLAKTDDAIHAQSGRIRAENGDMCTGNGDIYTDNGRIIVNGNDVVASGYGKIKLTPVGTSSGYTGVRVYLDDVALGTLHFS